MLKPYVRFCSAMLLVLRPEMLSPSRTKILSGFLQAMLAPFRGTANWGQLRRFWGCVEGYMGSFGAMLLRRSRKQPADTPPKRPPLALKARQNQIKNCPETQKPRPNVTKNPHLQNALSSGPAASTSCATGKIKGYMR